MLVQLSLSNEMLATALVQVFWQPASSLAWWAGPCTWDKQRVYGLPRATYVVMFHCACFKIAVWAIRVHFGSYLQAYGG